MPPLPQPATTKLSISDLLVDSTPEEFGTTANWLKSHFPMNRSILNGLLIKLLPSMRTHRLFSFNDFELLSLVTLPFHL